MNDAQAILVVCDAGPLIHLDQLDNLDLLSDFSRLVVPDVAWREVEQHRQPHLTRKRSASRDLSPAKDLRQN
jgi:hypothetical protein